MPKFSKTSLARLATCHPDLQRLFNEVIKKVDVSIVCGIRGKEEQNMAFANHSSTLQWPKSKHNRIPSLAVDVIPYPEGYDNVTRFKEIAMIIKETAEELGIKVKWGGDWGWKNGKQTGFVDRPHWELEEA